MIKHVMDMIRRLEAVPSKPAAIVVAVAVVLGGCAVGPEYQRPTLSLPLQFKQQASPVGSLVPGASNPDHRFWRAFGDAELVHLVEQSQTANVDLRVAMAHYERASSLMKEARFAQIPAVTLSAQGGHEKVSQDQSYGFPRSHNNYSAAMNASWEIDLFGRVRRLIEVQRAQVQAAEYDLEAMRIAIASETAATYLTLRGLQERLRVVKENVENQRQVLALVDVRVKAGRGTDFDTVRARAQHQATASRVPALEAGIAAAQHRLAVLTGQQPEALDLGLSTQKLPTLPERIDPDAPGELLRRRPDIAAAEERLKAATARVGVAVGDLFPKFSFSGLFGYQAFDADEVFTGRGAMNHAFLGVDWSFLDIGRVRARVAASEADADAMLLQYQQAVLIALEDTENALVRYSRTRGEDAMLEQAALDSTKAAEMARFRYQAGKTDLYELLDAERALLSAQEAFADVRTRSALTAVALYKALAGGWPQQDVSAAKHDASLTAALTQSNHGTGQ